MSGKRVIGCRLTCKVIDRSPTQFSSKEKGKVNLYLWRDNDEPGALLNTFTYIILCHSYCSLKKMVLLSPFE